MAKRKNGPEKGSHLGLASGAVALAGGAALGWLSDLDAVEFLELTLSFTGWIATVAAITAAWLALDRSRPSAVGFARSSVVLLGLILAALTLQYILLASGVVNAERHDVGERVAMMVAAASALQPVFMFLWLLNLFARRTRRGSDAGTN